MNGSTVGDSRISGQSSGQCQSCGLYTAYGAQFMIGSCQTIAVDAMAMSTNGCPGCRRHTRKQPKNNQSIPITVPHSWISSQTLSLHPNKNGTGRGMPVTSGFAMRGDTAPMRAKWAMTAINAKAAPNHNHGASERGLAIDDDTACAGKWVLMLVDPVRGQCSV